MTTAPQLPAFDDSAACVQIGTDAYFPSGEDETHGAKGRGRVTETIRAICGACPWHNPCYDYALHHGVQGIWGGTSEYERIRERNRLGMKPISVTASYHQPNRLTLEDGAA